MTTQWLQRVPPDLSRHIDTILSYRGPQDVWVEVRDWLIKHGVEAPPSLPSWESLEGAERSHACGYPTEDQETP